MADFYIYLVAGSSVASDVNDVFYEDEELPKDAEEFAERLRAEVRREGLSYFLDEYGLLDDIEIWVGFNGREARVHSGLL